jgi:hypothetical protein
MSLADALRERTGELTLVGMVRAATLFGERGALLEDRFELVQRRDGYAGAPQDGAPVCQKGNSGELGVECHLDGAVGLGNRAFGLGLLGKLQELAGVDARNGADNRQRAAGDAGSRY